jgi:Plasmid pRiA4b ORF-3-like protein
MDAHPAADPPNRYCQRLGLPTPNLDVALARADTKVIHLMALAVLEAGRPLSLEAIADRLAQLALPPRFAAAANPASLRKAWHGQAPLVRDPRDGRFYLDLLADHEVRWISYLADPRGMPSPRPRPEEDRQPSADEPLSQDEVDAAFRDRTLYDYSTIRQAAAILEATGGGPLSFEEINERLAAHGARAGHIDERAVRLWKSDLVLVDPDGRLRLNRTSLGVPACRRDIRRMAASRLRQQAEDANFRARIAEHETRRAEEARQAMDEARAVRRAVVHVVASEDGVPRAAAVVDTAAREQRLFIGEALSELPAHLEAFDFLAGVDLRPSLRSLGLDPDRWWLAELRPTQRTFRPSDREAVAVRLPAVVQATTDKARVPADPRAWKSLFAARSTRRVEARLAEEAQALFALFQYGALHGGVRVRRRAGERLMPVAWSMRGDAQFGDIIDAATRHWLPVQIVVGRSADLADPWPLARSVTIVERDRHLLYVREGSDVRSIDPADIRACRLPPGAATPKVSRLSWLETDSRICRMTVTLDGIQPPIWRRLEVPARVTMAKLHQFLQAALGWTDSHLHVFEIGDERISVPYHADQLAEGQITRSGRLVHLSDVVDHGVRRFDYEYDFGDSWRHTIVIEEVRDERDGDGGARCLGGARACPPEDCGGADGYARLLEILFDPRHPEFEEIRAWARRFEPERFDLGRVNAALAAIPAY